MVQAAVGDNLADVDETFDALGDLNEGAEVHELGDRAFHLGADGEGTLCIDPGIGEGLLEAERDAAFFRLDGQDEQHRRGRPA